MISLTILELLYLVLIFFTTIIGTLLIMMLLRVLKILRVGTELADMYFKVKEIFLRAQDIPDMIKERIISRMSETQETPEEKKESK